VSEKITYHVIRRTPCAVCHGRGRVTKELEDRTCYTCAGCGYYEILVPLDSVPLVQDILSELAALRRLTGLIQGEL